MFPSIACWDSWKDPQTARYIGGAAFHCWTNDPEQAEKTSARNGDFETECGADIHSDDLYLNDFNWWNRLRVIENARRGLTAVLAWNLVSDENAGPVSPGSESCKTCRGLIVVKPQGGGFTYVLNPENLPRSRTQRNSSRETPSVSIARAVQAALSKHVALPQSCTAARCFWSTTGTGIATQFSIRINGKVITDQAIGANEAATVVLDP